ncbi:hypothetical protein PRELSG_0209400 [Plasmodium relictum]|uniref:Uncharacterized protein n=1 Tax=Plasmodium relictum TaxID=85471 RepID=A0A1J1HGV7_PLARL|nr:hypothetical protein PRELSG_0209400 [Plasmodium relictum]CRH03069.1 hypothetical protein PRELSG_0209400 [Plasmodium relictum]
MKLFLLKELKTKVIKVTDNTKKKEVLPLRKIKTDYYSLYRKGYTHMCENSLSYISINIQKRKNNIYKMSSCFINSSVSQKFVKNNDFSNGSIYFNINNSLFFLKNFALIIDVYLEKKVLQFSSIPNFDIILFYQKIIQKMNKRKKRNKDTKIDKIFYITYNNNLKKNFSSNILYVLNKKNFDEILYLLIKILYEYLPKNLSILYSNTYYYEDLIYIFTYKSVYYSFFFCSRNFYYLNLFLNIALRRANVISVVNDNKINTQMKLKPLHNILYNEKKGQNHFKFQGSINYSENDNKKNKKNYINNEISYYLLKKKLIYLNLDSKILFEFSKTLKAIINIFPLKIINKANKEDKLMNEIYIILDKYIEMFKLCTYNIFLNSIYNRNDSLRYRLLRNDIKNEDKHKKKNIYLSNFYNCIYNFNNYFCRKILMGMYFNSHENKNNEIKWINVYPYILSTFLYIKEKENLSYIKKEKLAFFNSYKNKEMELYFKDLIKLFLFIILNKSNNCINNILIYCIISSFYFLTIFSRINLNIILDITNILFKYIYNKNNKLNNIECFQNSYIINLSKKIIYSNIISFEKEKFYIQVNNEKLIDYLNTLYFISESKLIKDNLFLLMLNHNKTKDIHRYNKIMVPYKDFFNEELYFENNEKNNIKFRKYDKDKNYEYFMNNYFKENYNLEYKDDNNNNNINNLINMIKYNKQPHEIFLKKFIKNTFISYNHIDSFTYKNFIDISQIIKNLYHLNLYLFMLIFIEYVKYKIIKDISIIYCNFQINYLNNFSAKLSDLYRNNARNIKILNLFIKKEKFRDKLKFNELKHFSSNEHKISYNIYSHFSFLCVFLQNTKSYIRTSSLEFFNFIISNFFVNKKKMINLCIWRIEEIEKKEQIYIQLFLKNIVQLIYCFLYFNTYDKYIYHYFYLFLKLQFFKNIKDNEEFFNNSKAYINMHLNKKIFLFPYIFFNSCHTFFNITLSVNKKKKIINRENNYIYSLSKKKREEFEKIENTNIFQKNEYLNNEKIGMLFYMQFSYLLLPSLFHKIFENHFELYILNATYLFSILINSDFYINSQILYKQIYIGLTCLYFFYADVKQKVYENNEELNFPFFQKINVVYLKKIMHLLLYEYNDKEVSKFYTKSSKLENEIYCFLENYSLKIRRNVKIHAYLLDFVLYNK